MKDFYKKTIEKILKRFSKVMLSRYNPKIVAITGSVGKTSTKEAIYTVLKKDFSVRRSVKNYNNELGVPLTILNLQSGGRSVFMWLGILIKATLKVLFKEKYPEILILEMGADRPGDLKYLVDFVKPDISVVTSVGPSHLEFFESIGQIAGEKGTLVKALNYGGTAILNCDDSRVRSMNSSKKVNTLTYGIASEDSDIRALVDNNTFTIDADDWVKGKNRVRNSKFKVVYRGTSLPVRIPAIGQGQIYASLAAIAVGITFQMNLVDIAKALENYNSPKGRLRLIEGIKNTMIIDDTYNSAPTSAMEALSVLEKVRTSGRKIAMLGDMLELGVLTEESHRKVGKHASEIADILISVGPKSEFISDEARKNGMSLDHIKQYGSVYESMKELEEIIEPNDVILVKASQAIRLELAVKDIMAEPLKARDFLVRQDKGWETLQ